MYQYSAETPLSSKRKRRIHNTAMWIILENIIVHQTNQSQKITYGIIQLCDSVSPKLENMYRQKIRLVVVYSYRDLEEIRVTIEIEFLWGLKNVSKLTSMIVVHVCRYTKNH